MNDASAFSETYAEARGKFLAAARGCGAALANYRHPGQGPAGEELYFDVAVLGRADAPRVLVVGCGTHGIEGYSGSAAQTAWMRGGGAQRVPAGTALVFFHGHNPWGFAHRSRCTEENVDLNRNFVDFAQPRPANPGYAELHPVLTPSAFDDATLAGIFRRLDEYRARVGEQGFSDAFNGGQYAHPDGLVFGGERRQWSAATFLEALRTHVSHAKQAAIIDLHTGIGPYLGHIYLCFHQAGTPGYERARAWWGDRAVNREGVTHKAVASYQGLLVNAFCAALPQAETTAVVVEFGTRPRQEMQRALMAGRWLRYEGPKAPELAPAIRAVHDEAFYPADPAWRAAVLEQSREFLDRAVAGISAS